MKTPFLFCCLLFHLTACVFAWKAESITGLVLGYLAVIISTAVIVKTLLSIILASGRNRASIFLDGGWN